MRLHDLNASMQPMIACWNLRIALLVNHALAAAQPQPQQTFAYAGLFGASAGSAQPDPSTQQQQQQQQQPQQQGYGSGFAQSGYGSQAPAAAQPARYGIVPPPMAAPAPAGALTLPPPGVLRSELRSGSGYHPSPERKEAFGFLFGLCSLMCFTGLGHQHCMAHKFSWSGASATLRLDLAQACAIAGLHL